MSLRCLPLAFNAIQQLLGPLAAEDSPAIICIGLNYKKHALEAGVDLDKLPPNPPGQPPRLCEITSSNANCFFPFQYS